MCVKPWEDQFLLFLSQTLCNITTFPFRIKALERFLWLLLFFSLHNKVCYKCHLCALFGDWKGGRLMLGVSSDQRKNLVLNQEWMKHNASSGKPILQRPKRHMRRPFLQIRYLLIFGRKTEESREVGADVMWIHSREQTVFNDNV